MSIAKLRLSTRSLSAQPIIVARRQTRKIDFIAFLVLFTKLGSYACGSNSIKIYGWSLTEPRLGTPKFRDRLEAKLHEMVCSGDSTSRQPNMRSLQNWIEAYKKYVSPQSIQLAGVLRPALRSLR